MGRVDLGPDKLISSTSLALSAAEHLSEKFTPLAVAVGGVGASLYLIRENRRLKKDNIQFSTENDRLEKDSTHDHLTGILNRRAFDEIYQTMDKLSRRSGVPNSLIELDIDHFKRLNDQYGHLKGDEVLKHVARTLTGRARESDIVARWGGEEFMVLLPETSLDQALVLAEDLREAITGVDVDGITNVTASFGVAENGSTQLYDQVVARADRALYKAKHGGRNRVEAADPAPLSIPPPSYTPPPQ